MKSSSLFDNIIETTEYKNLVGATYSGAYKWYIKIPAVREKICGTIRLNLD